MIKEITLSDLQPFMAEAKRANLTFAQDTQYYGYYIGDLLAGFTGVRWLSDKAIFKNAYVSPAYRRKGIYKTMFDYRAQLAKYKGLKIIEASCTPMSLPLYLAAGATVIKQYKNGVTKVRLSL